MEAPPDIPKPPPEISAGWVWTSLAAPPVATLVGSGTVAFNDVSPVYLGVVVPFVLGLTGVGSAIFHRTMSKRYRGISMTLMEAGYLLGQLVVCSALGTVILFLFIGVV